MVRLYSLIVLFVAGFALPCADGQAQALTAEQAFAAGDHARAAELAEAALSAGGLKPAQWAFTQRTLGLARAHLGQSEQARRAFICALALEPEQKLTSEQSIEVRSPFMEARGFWSQHAQRLFAAAALSEDRKALIVSLVDPAALAARVIVRARAAGQGRFVESALPPASTLLVSLETLALGAGVEYSLSLIDENGNRLWQQGSDSAPLGVGLARPERVVPRAATSPTRLRPPRDTPPVAFPRRPYYVGAAVSLLVAGASVAVAGVSHRERERLAQRWNDSRCEGEGSTRGEICGRERGQIERAERLAIGFYAVAGAGLVAGIVTLVMAPARTRDAVDARAFRCRPGPGLAGLECGAKF